MCLWNTTVPAEVIQGQGHKMTCTMLVSSESVWPKEYVYQLLSLYLEQIKSYRQGRSLCTYKLAGQTDTQTYSISSQPFDPREIKTGCCQSQQIISLTFSLNLKIFNSIFLLVCRQTSGTCLLKLKDNGGRKLSIKTLQNAVITKIFQVCLLKFWILYCFITFKILEIFTDTINSWLLEFNMTLERKLKKLKDLLYFGLLYKKSRR